ncbi:hypothetical protein EDB83DRAFT_1932344 [Lactarius deliciosus]|nr:hypothetical protein EDB83DRAFT_1932344 [Lactarius deliciosus]
MLYVISRPCPSPSTPTKGRFIAVTTLVCMCVADLVRNNGFTSVSSSFRIIGNVRESISVGHCWPVLLPDIVLVASEPVSGPVLCIPWDTVWAVHSRCKLGKRVDVEQLRGDVNGDNHDAHLATCAAASNNDHPMDFPHPHNHQTYPPFCLRSWLRNLSTHKRIR